MSKVSQFGAEILKLAYLGQIASIRAKVLILGCLGRKCPNWGENPKIGMLKSKKVFFSKIFQKGHFRPKWDIFDLNTPISGFSP